MNKWMIVLMIYGALLPSVYAQDYLPDKAIDPGRLPSLPSMSDQKPAGQVPSLDDTDTTRVLVPKELSAELVQALARQEINFEIEAATNGDRIGRPVSILEFGKAGLNEDALRIIRSTCPQCQGIPGITPTFSPSGTPGQGSGAAHLNPGLDLSALVAQCSMSKDLMAAAEAWLGAHGIDPTTLTQARCPQEKLAEILVKSRPTPEKAP